jgi:16S rRNA (adenine1518-N6/adenine1519-N6)-dimethyltransferase
MLPLNVPALLNQFGLRPKKSLGQNFLTDETALQKIVAAADVTQADEVLEIGPGLGSLTRHLAAAAHRIVAIELDQTLLHSLEYVLGPFSNVEILHGDILETQISKLKLQPGYKVVANIPYYITSAVVQHLLEADARPSTVVLTEQKEVAERMCAEPGDMSLLAVSVQFYAQPRIVARISAGAFYPKPDVDSAVVRLDVWPQPVVAVDDVRQFFRVVKAGFSQKRKQLRNAVSGGLHLDPDRADEALLRAGIDPKRRAETVTLAEWGNLCAVLSQSEVK